MTIIIANLNAKTTFTAELNKIVVLPTDNVSVHVRHDHDVELFRIADQLHASVVHYHAVELDVRKFLGYFAAAFQKQTVGQLPEIYFVCK